MLNLHYGNGSIHRIGKLSQLAASVKIASSKHIQETIKQQGRLITYSQWLPKEQSLVRCVQTMDDAYVFGAYVPEHISYFEQQAVEEPTWSTWSVMEINPKLYAELLEGVDLDKGLLLQDLTHS